VNPWGVHRGFVDLLAICECDIPRLEHMFLSPFLLATYGATDKRSCQKLPSDASEAETNEFEIGLSGIRLSLCLLIGMLMHSYSL
jgi:hypothetical protein